MPTSRNPRRWRAAALGCLLLVGIAAHGTLLRAAHGVLVDTQPIESVEYVVLLLGGEPHVEMVHQLLQSGRAQCAILVDGKPSYAVQIGALPVLSDVASQELIQRGVPQASLVSLASQARTDHERVRVLDRWLRAEGATRARAAILCPRQTSHYFRRIVDTTVRPRRRERLLVWSPPTSAYHESTWWRSRTGIKKVMFGYFRLAFLYLQGEGDVHSGNWDPEAYERMLIERRAVRAEVAS